MHADVEPTIGETIGLRLPDGTEIFPPDTFHGRGLTTAEDRQVILNAIAQSADNLGMASHELLSRYTWLVRGHQVITLTIPMDTTEVALDDPSLTTPPPPPPAPVDVAQEDSDPLQQTLPPSV